MHGLEEQLTSFLGDLWAEGPPAIENLIRLSGGASRETWAFEAVLANGDRVPLVLRRDPPTQPRPERMLLEAAAIGAASRAGVPVPAVIAFDGDGGSLGAPFMLMEHVPGETIPRRLLRDDEFAPARPLLARQCGEILARIHSIPVDDVPGLEGGDALADTRAMFDAFGRAHPALELGFRWLEANRPAMRSDAVVHGDFRNGNLMVGADGVRAVLDWELLHRGDPMEDLGWLCVKAWRFGSPEPVGGFGSYEQLFDGYERVSGERVDPDVFRWWQVLGTLRWGVICMLQSELHLSGAVRSVELAAIGRRVCEQEHDLLLLLHEAGW